MFENRVPTKCQIRAVELKHQTGINDGLVLTLHDLGQREDVFLFGAVMQIGQEPGDLAR